MTLKEMSFVRKMHSDMDSSILRGEFFLLVSLLEKREVTDFFFFGKLRLFY